MNELNKSANKTVSYTIPSFYNHYFFYNCLNESYIFHIIHIHNGSGGKDYA